MSEETEKLLRESCRRFDPVIPKTTARFRPPVLNDKKNQILEVNHKVFESQNMTITPGAWIGGTQQSRFIRPQSEVIAGGVEFEPGRLRKEDMHVFVWGRMNRDAVQWFKDNLETPVYYYQFFTSVPECACSRNIYHGEVITDPVTHEVVASFPPTRKRSRVIFDACLSFITPYDGPDSVGFEELRKSLLSLWDFKPDEIETCWDQA